MTRLDWLNTVGSVASVVGLVVSLYTLYKVANLPAALKRRSRDQRLTELIDEITNLPASKSKLTESKAGFILQTVQEHYVSRWGFRDRTLKKMLTTLETELKGERRPEIIKRQLQFILDEITIR